MLLFILVDFSTVEHEDGFNSIENALKFYMISYKNNPSKIKMKASSADLKEMENWINSHWNVVDEMAYKVYGQGNGLEEFKDSVYKSLGLNIK